MREEKRTYKRTHSISEKLDLNNEEDLENNDT